MSDADVIQSARGTLAEACLAMGVRPTEDALYWMLGLVWGESRFGTSPDWTIPNAENDPSADDGSSPPGNPGAPEGPSHNWGSLRTSSTSTFIWHGDRSADGAPGVFRFARFGSALDGAKAFLRTLLRGDVPAIVASDTSTAHDLAAAMYANRYYTGTSGTADDRINAYTNMILAGASKVRTAVGASPPSPGALAPFASAARSATPLVLALACGAGAYMLMTKQGPLRFLGRRLSRS